MSRYRDQVAAALGAVTIRGPTRFVWLGHVSRALPASLDAVLDDRARRSYLVSTLREELYASFFCQGRPVPARGGRSEPDADPWLTAAMSQANTGDGGWEPGWTVERVEGAEAVVDDRAPADARPRRRLPRARGRAATRHGRQRPHARGAPGAVAGLLHGGERGSCRRRGGGERRARVLEHHPRRRRRAGRRAHRAAQCRAGAVPLEGRRSSVPPGSLRRRRPLPPRPELHGGASGRSRTPRMRCGRICRRASPPSPSSWLPASGWPRRTAAVRASASGAARSSPTRSCAPMRQA